MGKKNRFNFAKKAVESLPVPESGAEYYYDTKVRGLVLMVTASGTRTFQLYRKIEGRPRRIAIGRFPDLDVQGARRKAEELNAGIARGQNPAEERRAARKQGTLGELFEDYVEHHAKVHKRTWHQDQRQFDLYLDGWKGRKLSTIRRADVERLHAAIGEKHGKYAANRLVSLLSILFRKGIEWGMFEGPNPATHIRRFPEQSRRRFIQPQELPAFFKAVMEEPDEAAKHYILISLLSGARKANVQAMAWKDVDLQRAVWTIPATATKGGESIEVPLVPMVVAILDQRKKEAADSVWVFPAKSRSGHLEEPRYAWERILTRAKLRDLRLHDLRRSLASYQAAAGASLLLIGRTLGHKSQAATAVYSRLSLDPVRESLEITTENMLRAAGLLKPEREPEEQDQAKAAG